jgi:hypothetical protein
VNFAETIASFAQSFTAAGLGAFHDAIARWPGTPVMSGGSIVTPGTPIEKPCSVQIDAATAAMRAADGFIDGDVRMLVLSASLEGALDNEATIEVLAGPNAGSWMVASVARDPMGVCWEARGRRA